ncbi:uncharacterized protein dok2 isoform X2 [Genypterus blacodes]
MYVFAADRQQLDDWIHKLCEIAFPMSWAERGMKRGSLQRGRRVDEDMEENSLYGGRQTVCDFRVCIRRTEASERCRLKGEFLLRADVEALLLLELKTSDVLFGWPYRYLRRFGRDKSTFSFEAGRRCDSGEGSFEFDTKQGNVLFQAVEAAINQQRIALPHRQTSGGAPDSPETPHSKSLPPLPLNPPMTQGRTQSLPHHPLTQDEGVYSTVKDVSNFQLLHHKDRDSSSSPPHQQRRPLQMSRLEPPVDKTLTGVKSLTLDTRGVPIPRKNQVKMISSCPLPKGSPEFPPSLALGPSLTPGSLGASTKISLNPELGQMYSQITGPGAPGPRGPKRERRGDHGGAVAPSCTPTFLPQEPEYSLPFDTIAKNIMAEVFDPHQAGGSGADPLYDSIDESKIRSSFQSVVNTLGPTYSQVEHIYDEPEGCAAAAATTAQRKITPASVYDDPEEMRVDAWKIMGTAGDPKGHEYPYNPRMDDYAVPKRVQRAFHPQQSTNQEGEGQQQEEETEIENKEEVEETEVKDSRYNNVTM